MMHNLNHYIDLSIDKDLVSLSICIKLMNLEHNYHLMKYKMDMYMLHILLYYLSIRKINNFESKNMYF